MNTDRRIITLTEYETRTLARNELPAAVAETLWRDYARQIAIEPPSFKTGDRWQLTAQGWVGYIATSTGMDFALQPKAPLRNLFRMLEYAYGLQSLHFEDELFHAASLLDFYEQLALILARRVLDRCRRGIYRAYLDHAERLPYVRGQLHVPQMARSPWQPDVPCHYEEQTADVEDNRLLGWALHAIVQSGLCTERTLPTVRRAYRALRPSITIQPYDAQACRSRRYHRLNRDYRSMHALCYFFLDQSGPSHELGDHAMLSFTVDMARLYEQFVAAWLAEHLPPPHRVRSQEAAHVGDHADVRFQADLVLYQAAADQACAIMDTKYKTPRRGPESADVQQVLAYAHAVGADQALLIYPVALARPLDEDINGIRVRSETFALDGDLEQQGRAFLERLRL